MGFFSELFGIDNTPKESSEEIKNRIENAEASKVFLSYLVEHFSQGNEYYQYLISNTRDRCIFLKFYKDGMVIEFKNMSYSYHKNNGTYDVDATGLIFGSAGYADLPNSSYVTAFENFIVNGLKETCPHLEINSSNVVRIKESTKIGW
ncbi:MAG: hypothetical protein IJZ07_08430 [Clostridia bacterium]|nr:hypothetical protein [Clostridia bacterium]